MSYNDGDPFWPLVTDLDHVNEAFCQWPADHVDSTLARGSSMVEELFQNLPDYERSMEIDNIVASIHEESNYTQPQPMEIQQMPLGPVLAQPLGVLPQLAVQSFEDVTTSAAYGGHRAADAFLHVPTAPPEPQPTMGGLKRVGERSDGDTKQELMRLLSKMSSSDVQRLVHTSAKPERAPSVVGVATRMAGGRALGGGASASRLAAHGGESPATPTAAAAGADDSDGDDGPSRMQPLASKTERRSAHNLIEKKYRCSINDKIGELRVMLAGDDAKLSKSATLRKAVEHIAHLQRQNEHLRRENQQLRQALGDRALSKDGGALSPLSDMSSRCASTGSGNSSPDNYGSRSPLSSPFVKSQASDHKPMLDKSRVTLFALMLGVLVFNPLGALFGSAAAGVPVGLAQPRGPGRTLLSAPFDAADETAAGWHEQMLRVMGLWLLNGIVIACVLARLLVYGEPVPDVRSPPYADYQRQRHAAQLELQKGNLCESARLLAGCLHALGRPLPTSALDGWAALCWQVARHALHLLWVGRWMSRQRRSGVKRGAVESSNGEAAVVVHKLHQLHLLGCAHGDTVSGVAMAVSAVNLAEAAGAAIDGSTLVDIYVNAALRVKHSLTKRCRIFVIFEAYFLARAGNVSKRCASQQSAVHPWLFHPVGRIFWYKHLQLGKALSLKASSCRPYCTLKQPDETTQCITAAFKLYLLRKMVETILYYEMRPSGDTDNCLNGRPIVHVMEWSHLLAECCAVDGEAGARDDVCFWWTQLLTCVIHWACDDFAQAHRKYQQVRGVPATLLSDNLALALGHAFCSRKLCLENKNQKHYEQVVWVHSRKARQSCEAFEAWRRSCAAKLTAIAAISARARAPLGRRRRVQELVQVLVYDWLLSSMVDVWQDSLTAGLPYWKQPAAAPLLALFHSLLSNYRRLENQQTWLRPKMLLYEAAGRMLSGANAVKTLQLLRGRSLVADEDELTETDRARLFHLTRLHDSILRS